jgi:hypothetical protein
MSSPRLQPRQTPHVIKGCTITGSPGATLSTDDVEVCAAETRSADAHDDVVVPLEVRVWQVVQVQVVLVVAV